MTIGVYCLTNTVTNKKYIGSSFNIEKRINKHFNQLLKNNHHNKHLQFSYNKYGRSSFNHKILETLSNVSDIELRKCEDKYINLFDKQELYNQCPVAGSTKGRKFSQHTKNKISQSMLGKPSVWKGKKFSKEHCNNISNGRKGKPSNTKGKSKPTQFKRVAQIDLSNNAIVNIFESIKEAANSLNIYNTRISEVCHGKKVSAGGFGWKLIDNATVA